MRFKQVYSNVWVVVVLAAFLFVGNAFAGGGLQGGPVPVDPSAGVLTGPEAWAVITMQCEQGSSSVDITLRAKALENCNVKTDTVIANGLFQFDTNNGESCPSSADQLATMLLYYSFPPVLNLPPLFGSMTQPTITKIKNPSVEIGANDLTTISFDAQLKNYIPNP